MIRECPHATVVAHATNGEFLFVGDAIGNLHLITIRPDQVGGDVSIRVLVRDEAVPEPDLSLYEPKAAAADDEENNVPVNDAAVRLITVGRSSTLVAAATNTWLRIFTIETSGSKDNADDGPATALQTSINVLHTAALLEPLSELLLAPDESHMGLVYSRGQCSILSLPVETREPTVPSQSAAAAASTAATGAVGAATAGVRAVALAGTALSQPGLLMADRMNDGNAEPKIVRLEPNEAVPLTEPIVAAPTDLGCLAFFVAV